MNTASAKPTAKRCDDSGVAQFELCRRKGSRSNITIRHALGALSRQRKQLSSRKGQGCDCRLARGFRRRQFRLCVIERFPRNRAISYELDFSVIILLELCEAGFRSAKRRVSLLNRNAPFGFLIAEIVEHGLCFCERCFRRLDAHGIVIALDFGDDISGFNGLVIRDGKAPDIAANACAQYRRLGFDKRILRRLRRAVTRPRIPVGNRVSDRAYDGGTCQPRGQSEMPHAR